MSPSLPLCNRLLSRLECNRLPSRPYTYLRSSTGPLPPRASVAASARRATAFLLSASATVNALAPRSASATASVLAPVSASATVSALAPVSALATVSALAPLPALARRHCFCFGHCHPSRADWPPLPLPLSVTDWPLPSLPYRLAAVAIAPFRFRLWLPLPPLPSPHWPVAPPLFPFQPWPVATASAPSTGPSPLLPILLPSSPLLPLPPDRVT